MHPEFTAADIAEARRLNAKLDKLPRLRMQTWIGRVFLNACLRLFELYSLLRGARTSARRELRTVQSLGRRVKLWIFHPAGVPQGIVLDIHGGGWTIGNARFNDAENARRATRLDVAIVSVDYGLALSAPVTALIDDCEAAAVWVLTNGEQEFGARRMIVKGASAGAHLAALTILRLRNHHRLLDAVDGVVLFFGLYDFAGTPMVRRASSKNLVLHGPTVRATLRSLTPDMTDDERRSPTMSPLYADLSGLPPALFVVGGEDMLMEDNCSVPTRPAG